MLQEEVTNPAAILPGTPNFALMKQSIQNSTLSAQAAKLRALTRDHEVFIQSQSPLILINDSNMQTPAVMDGPKHFQDSMFKFNHHDVVQTTRRRSKPRNSQDQTIISDYDEEQSALNPGQSDDQGSKKARQSLFSVSRPEIPLQEEEESTVDIFQEAQNKEGKKNKVILYFREILRSPRYNIIMGVLTFYALFADNLRDIFFTQNGDTIFDALLLTTLAIFILEILINLFVTDQYLGSFFFYVDIISTISILFDVNLVSASFFVFKQYEGLSNVSNQVLSRTIAMDGKVVRIARIAKIISVYREFANEYEMVSAPKQNSSNKVHPFRNQPEKPTEFVKRAPRKSFFGKLAGAKDPNFAVEKSPSRQMKELIDQVAQQSAFNQEPDFFEEKSKKSRVGKKLADLTVKRVIVLVLAVALIIPLCTADYFFNQPDSMLYELNLLGQILNNTKIDPTVQDNATQFFIDQEASASTPLIYLQLNNLILYSVASENLDDNRVYEVVTTIMQTKRGKLTCIISAKTSSVFAASLEFLKNLYICLVLIFGAFLFDYDARNLIIRPIERIIEKVNIIARNPLAAKDNVLMKGNKDKDFENETVEIENAIVKIGGLLALGFGEAGSTIVASNMAHSGDIDPMLPGKRKAAIFGFCDIRNFTDATEVLQEEVMIFVNSIADIVHSMVDKYTGAANKNIGDAFLLVWKIPDDMISYDRSGNAVLEDTIYVQNMVDFSLMSFCKIYARINRDPTLLRYGQHAGLNARIPNYRVKMGFGLHLGWAIEGAIGSEYKIDASYLSPNVNMASRLEAATKQYGVPLLFSGDLYKHLSAGLKHYARLIDIITVKGSIKPIKIYTIDMDATEFGLAKDRDLTPKDVRSHRQTSKKKLIRYLLNEGSASSLLLIDKEFKHMVRNKNQDFDQFFEQGFEAYIRGDWPTARKRFMECQKIRENDGPTNNLMSLLDEYDYIAPEEWPGYHVLTEK